MKQGGSAEEALQTFVAMRRQLVRPNMITYSTLINACEKTSYADKALTLFRELQAKGWVPNLIVYTAVIRAHEKQSQPAKSFAVL